MHYYIITGASRGLGKALAEAALELPDASVLGVSRHATITHERYTHQPLDLSDMLAVQNNLHKVFSARPGAKSITLINNAAVLGEIGYLGEHQNEHFEFVFDVNTVAPAMFINTFLSAYSGLSIPRTILNISSGAAQRAVDGWGAYSASKAALDALSKTAQKEQDLRGTGVRIRSLSPGILDTPMQEHIRSADEHRFSEAAKFAGFHTSGQLAEPDEVASKIIDWLQRPAAEVEPVVLRITELQV
ncbi:SDR family NAD(P)-dependent oxidoreductase [Hymenobacter taeanensis]|uniref:SDR family NAD(P)-dependent oxidoreductase n=1 Tax=Hymenobacter taeanensis TaxID=2735321 RepID=A0A6M6BCW4_9BACT|nr:MULTISPECIES: SDR family NAD(P)-dependent oxidoreductase [Hymenobacter]QJX45802.1 SDR family NAD(P)-dependent oxidoreductase [Hymenobacter taeanensis]UOQ79645.1 SDR family NAD(P)-dependent oxidoreductase [Hymenobacter sp. 5414T-23]